MKRRSTIPISVEEIKKLHTGDSVALTGILVTGRDAVHKWMIDTFIRKTREPQGDDLEVYEAVTDLEGKPDLSLWAGRSRNGKRRV